MFEAAFGLKFDSYLCCRGEFPTDLYPIYFITGSKYSAYDKDPWIDQLKRFLKTVEAQNAKIFGVCFGHQILAEALGGKGIKLYSSNLI